MQDNKNTVVAKFNEGDSVQIALEKLFANELHYGEIDNATSLTLAKGKVLKSDYDRHVKEMSYQIQFEEVKKGGKFWFLESELY
jgi:hypothetical protein